MEYPPGFISEETEEHFKSVLRIKYSQFLLKISDDGLKVKFMNWICAQIEMNGSIKHGNHVTQSDYNNICSGGIKILESSCYRNSQKVCIKLQQYEYLEGFYRVKPKNGYYDIVRHAFNSFENKIFDFTSFKGGYDCKYYMGISIPKFFLELYITKKLKLSMDDFMQSNLPYSLLLPYFNYLFNGDKEENYLNAYPGIDSY